MNYLEQSGFDAIQGCISSDVRAHRKPDDYSHVNHAVGIVLYSLLHYCASQNIDFMDELNYAKNQYLFSITNKE